MAASVIGALRVNLGLDSAQFERGLGQAKKRLGDMRKQFVAFSAMAGAAAAGLGALTTATARTANEITRFSQVAGAAPSDLQKWAAGAKTVGIEQDKLADILKDVNDRIGDYAATGGGPMVDFFENIAPKVGVTADQFRKLSGPDALQLYVSSLEKAGASQQDMTFYLEAMASDATALLPLLRNNGAEMQRLAGNAQSLGAVMSDSTVAALNSAHLAFQDVGLAMQGIGNRIAGSLAPGLTMLATGFADAMREGAWLRTVTDALIDNLSRLATYAATAVTWFGTRYVGALVLAKAATLGLVGSLKLLRGALIRTGIGAMIVAAGELVYQFAQLVQATGGFGNALSLLGDIASSVWRNMAKTGQGLYRILQGVASGIGAAFLNAFSVIARQWDFVLNGMAMPFNALMGALEIDARIGTSNIGGALGGIADEWEANAISRIQEGGGLLAEAAGAPLEKLRELRDAVNEIGSDTLGGGAASDRLAEALDGAGMPINDDAGGDSGKESAAEKKAKADAEKRAKVLKELRSEHDKLRATINMTDLQAKIWNDTQEAGVLATSEQGREIAKLNTDIDAMTQAKERAVQMADTLKQSAGSAFSSIVTGASSAKDALSNLAASLADMFADRAFDWLWGAIAPSIPGATPRVAIPGNANGTNNWRGGLTRVNELGGEIMNLPRGTQIIPHDISKRMAGGSGGVELILHAAEGVTIETVRNEAGAMIRQAAPGIKRDTMTATQQSMRTQPKTLWGLG